MRTFTLALTVLALFFAFPFLQANSSQEIKSMNVKRITPVLLVKEIEPLVPFWVDRLGFTKTIEVPDGNKLGFVAFQKGSAEVMYPTAVVDTATPDADTTRAMATAATSSVAMPTMDVATRIPAATTATMDVATGTPVTTMATPVVAMATPARVETVTVAEMDAAQAVATKVDMGMKDLTATEAVNPAAADIGNSH
jgi:hypothetical protein